MPAADELKIFTSSAYDMLHALDELRQQYGMKLGQIVPVSSTEIGAKAGLSPARVLQIADTLEEAGWIGHSPSRGFIQHRAIPQLKPAVKQ